MTVALYRTPKGHPVQFISRDGSNDQAMVTAVVNEDEYGLTDLPELSGWAMDVGAHVGSIAVSLAVDHPKLNVIAIEPLPENVQLIRESAELNGVADRVHIEEAAVGMAGDPPQEVLYYYDEGATQFELEQHRYVGNVFRGQAQVKGQRVTVPTVSIKGLAEKYGADEFCLVVTDCETGEWRFFAEDSEMCAEIRGERHDGDTERLAALLPAFDITNYSDNPGQGNFLAIRR